MGGILITLEGIEGSGKSTQLRLLKERFSAHRLPYFCSKEPGGTKLGGELRSLLLEPHPSGEKWCLEAELLLFYADRAQHLETIIRPKLLTNQIVVIDRFEDSTRAYQGAQGIPEKVLLLLRQTVLRNLEPDLTLLFDIDPAKSLARANSRNIASLGFAETRFDNEALCFHQKVREAFLNIARQEPDRISTINADQNQKDVSDTVWSAIAPKLVAAGFLQG